MQSPTPCAIIDITTAHCFCQTKSTLCMTTDHQILCGLSRNHHKSFLVMMRHENSVYMHMIGREGRGEEKLILQEGPPRGGLSEEP